MKSNTFALLRPLAAFALALLLVFPLAAQKRKTTKPPPPPAYMGYDETLYNSLQYRCVGPFRGGRSAAVCGVPGKPNLFYFGSTGGGVWRTQDGGNTWGNISDGFFGGSIGSIAVSDSDPNVIYVGGGEATVRGNVSYGYGIWKSEDAGKTWKNMGLPNSRHIPRIRIHPHNPDLVYAAVLGDLYKSSDERGLYRSKDGGKTWEKILFANADAGAMEVILDPSNPRNLYVSTWRVRRTPYSLESGGEGSALWKSTDGGDTWKNISANKGLPEGIWGIVGIAVSPVNNNRVWALIENENGGVYRSDDGGDTWRKLNDDRKLRQRAWYYTRIYADTKDQEIVYVVNVDYHKSTDGGVTFKDYEAPHGDHHDLWIAPEDNQRMIIADDGGAQISYDAGENWTTYHNQPTAQFYRVVTDDHFPYRIYGAQQDNSTIRIVHRTDGGSIGEQDWEETAGGESAHIAVDPLNNDIVYGGSYGGFLMRLNHRTKESRLVDVWPDNPMGYGAEGAKYRFQWNYPIFFSPNNPKKLYALSNHVHISYDDGNSWELASPDLTHNDSTKLGPSGGPITKDNTSVEYYCTLFAGAESPYEKDLLWVGSDDGLIHLSRDGGATWQNVTPKNMPEWMMINSIEPDPFVKGGAYVAGTRYKLGDYQPYLYHTKDYGKTWTLIVNGISADHFTRVVRADPKRQGLLYAGTETAMYISFDDGSHWQLFQLNLPTVPITDLTIKNNNLIVATQGRSFWMLDDLTPLHQLTDKIAKSDFYLYKPLDAYRMGGFQRKNLKTEGTNHTGGVMINFYLKEKPADSVAVAITFYEAGGDSIISYSTKAKEDATKLNDLKKGGNLFVWNMRYPNALRFDGMILWGASMAGPRAVPGHYKVKLTIGDKTQEQEFEILKDPRSDVPATDLQAQFSFVREVQQKVSEAHQAIIDIREVRKQLNAFNDKSKEDASLKELVEKAKAIDKAMTQVEEALYQTKNRSGQDPLNFPIKLTNKLGGVGSTSGFGDYAPTKQAYAVKEELTETIDAQLAIWQRIKKEDIPAFNTLVKDKGVDLVRFKNNQ